MNKLRILLLSYLFAATAARAQAPDSAILPEPKQVAVGLYYQGSFTIPHSPAMKHLAQSHPTGAELNLQLRTTGTEPWHELYKYPTFGINLVYYNYHEPVLGHSVATSIYINKAMWEGRKQQLNLRIGTGIAWFDRTYDLQENHKNSIISQRINAVMQARLEYEWHFSKPLSFSAGIGLNHYSNGATSKPNLGINLPTATIGLNYYTHRAQHFLKPPQPELNKSSYYNVSLGAGYSQLNFSDTRKYFALTTSLYWLKPLNRKSNLVVGVDGFYNESIIAAQKEDSTYTKSYNATRAAGLIGHELVFGKLIFQTHLAFYFYLPYLGADRIYYERLGVKYHFSRHLFGALALKVHRGSADVIEWTIGARIR